MNVSTPPRRMVVAYLLVFRCAGGILILGSFSINGGMTSIRTGFIAGSKNHAELRADAGHVTHWPAEVSPLDCSASVSFIPSVLLHKMSCQDSHQ